MAAERAVEQRFLAVEAVVAEVGTKLQHLGEKFEEVESSVQQMQTNVITFQAAISGEKADLLRSINEEMDTHKVAIANIKVNVTAVNSIFFEESIIFKVSFNFITNGHGNWI